MTRRRFFNSIAAVLVGAIALPKWAKAKKPEVLLRNLEPTSNKFVYVTITGYGKDYGRYEGVLLNDSKPVVIFNAPELGKYCGRLPIGWRAAAVPVRDSVYAIFESMPFASWPRFQAVFENGNNPPRCFVDGVEVSETKYIRACLDAGCDPLNYVRKT